MGPAIFLGGLVALSLLVLGATTRRAGQTSRTQTPPFREAVPWVAGGVLAVGGVLMLIPGVPAVVTAGLVAYTGVAVTAVWRMASLDRVSRWMLPSRRLARLGITAVALTWLGLVLGLLLRIADLVASAPYGP
jgi:uncharacterized membrane protein